MCSGSDGKNFTSAFPTWCLDYVFSLQAKECIKEHFEKAEIKLDTNDKTSVSHGVEYTFSNPEKGVRQGDGGHGGVGGDGGEPGSIVLVSLDKSSEIQKSIMKGKYYKR